MPATPRKPRKPAKPDPVAEPSSRQMDEWDDEYFRHRDAQERAHTHPDDNPLEQSAAIERDDREAAESTAAASAGRGVVPPARGGLYRDSQTVVMSGRHLRSILRAERAAQLDEVEAWLDETSTKSVVLRFRNRFERD